MSKSKVSVEDVVDGLCDELIYFVKPGADSGANYSWELTKALREVVSKDEELLSKLEEVDSPDEVYDHDKRMEVLDALIEGGVDFLHKKRPSLY